MALLDHQKTHFWILFFRESSVWFSSCGRNAVAKIRRWVRKMQ